MVAIQAETNDFHEQLKAVLPRLRIYAISLTRDRDRADDLVQEAVTKALIGRGSFRPGTNFAAWVFRIQRNEFISGLRRTRPTVPIDTAVAESLTQRPLQEGGLIMREFLCAFDKLSAGQREALVLSVIEGQPYDVIAAHAGVSVGTIKSRVSRARATLERLLTGDDVEIGGAVDVAALEDARVDNRRARRSDAGPRLSPAAAA